MGSVRRLEDPLEEVDLPSWATDVEKQEIERLLAIMQAVNELDSEKVPEMLDELGAANSIWFVSGVSASQLLEIMFDRGNLPRELTAEEKASENTLLSALTSSWVHGMVVGVQFALQKGLRLEGVTTHY